MEEREKELKEKRICRFCMTQEEPLTNIHSKENRIQSVVPLPVQILACTSIEVFTNDSLPATICESCRIMMDYCYRFKQICKTADTKLKQYPLTGQWPAPLEAPKLPITPDKPKKPVQISPTSSNYIYSAKAAQIIPAYQTLQQNTQTQKRPIVRQQMNAIHPPKKLKESSVNIASKQSSGISTSPVKILNKFEPTILNRQATPVKNQLIFTSPVIKTDVDGNIEVVTEVLDEQQIETDPTKDVEPVETQVYPCTACERSFPLRQLLEIHMKNHTRARDFECEICSKRFFSKYDLGKHMSIHTGEKPFKCVVCAKRFARSTLLTRHERCHVDEPKFLCVHCERTFLSQDELNKHTETHNKIRPFPCDICGKSFAFKQGLERHQVIHEKEKPFQCEHCDKSFTTPNKLARHLTAHAGRRPYPCKLCSKSFLLSHHLSRHLRSHTALETTIFKCIECNGTFQNRDELIYHSALHATENLLCPLCKETFSDLDHVTEHIKLHASSEQYRCDYCDLIFVNPEKLEIHCQDEHAEDHRGNEMQILKLEDADVQLVENDPLNNENYVLEEIGDPANKSVRIFSRKSKEASATTSTSPKNYPIINLNNSNANKKDNEVEVLAEFEIRRSNRTNKSKNYPNLIKSELADDNDEYEEYILSSPKDDDSENDEDVELQEIEIQDTKIEPIQENVKKQSPKAIKTVSNAQKPTESKISQASATPQSSSTQEKITRFLKMSTKNPIVKAEPKENFANTHDKSREIEKVIKSLPKGVTIIKTEHPPENEKSSIEKKSKKLSAEVQKHVQSLESRQKAGTPPIVQSNTPTTSKSKEIIAKSKDVAQSKVINVQNSSNKSDSNIAKLKPKPAEQQPSGKKSDCNPKKEEEIPKVQKNQKSSPVTAAKTEDPKQYSEMKIGDRMVKVQKIKMTKTQVDAMKKEGKIEVKDGAIILKNSNALQNGAGSTKNLMQQKRVVKSTNNTKK